MGLTFLHSVHTIQGRKDVYNEYDLQKELNRLHLN